MAEFLLVHGAWHGGWVWRDVAEGLRARGHKVFTPSLTGLGDRAHLLTPGTGVDQHRQDILAIIESEELRDAVLVGHSYGARPTALATAHPAVRAWISLDGVHVEPGTGLLDGAPPEALEAMKGTLVGGLGLPPLPAEAIGIPADHPGHDWVNRRQTPMPWRCLEEKMPLLPDRFADLPKTYVRALGNTLDAPAMGAIEARDSGWPAIDIDSGHDLPVTAAEETIEALDRAARA
ncbi:alpha/beta fold hydrolase [Sandaracinobacteroides sp. A072]|uniref:alpha/beta fold hydrolase n=1 Tax=Sandaracinobacteroides sp. A072 TaxID=3461146 RepID=UPI004042FABB